MKKLLMILAFAGLVFSQSACNEEKATGETKKTLTIMTPKGLEHTFKIELALTPEQHQQGLMFRESMPDDHGMLFIFPDERILAFWMKNTKIPLDIMFINKDGQIQNIARMNKPMDLTPIPSKWPSLAAFEVNGGVSDKLGITEGSRIIHPAFQE